MKIFICQVCGHIEFGKAPDKCPVCMAPKEKFTEDDEVFKKSSEKSPEAEIKHAPFITVNKSCGLVPNAGCTDILVRIGKTEHPMEEKHFITFIDCYQDGKYIERVSFTSQSVHPAACFHLKKDNGLITIVENCNIHGYWKSEVTAA